MDQLDILKENWQSQTSDTPRFTKEQLTGLLATKSSSIVKWIFVIAIIEFIVFSLIGIVGHYWNLSNGMDAVEILGKPLFYGFNILHYTALAIFIYLFYQNYKKISVNQPTRKLMNNILKTRRTMKWYIWYNLGFIMVTGMVSTVVMIPKEPGMQKLMTHATENGNETAIYFLILGVSFVVFLVMCVILFLIYQLIYGILLRKLKRNYNELKRMEV